METKQKKSITENNLQLCNPCFLNFDGCFGNLHLFVKISNAKWAPTELHRILGKKRSVATSQEESMTNALRITMVLFKEKKREFLILQIIKITGTFPGFFEMSCF